MWLQEPGSFTRIIAAMVTPRNTSSETIRPGRAVVSGDVALEACTEMVSAVAMVGPSDGGDSTAAEGMPQRRNNGHSHKKTWPGRGIPTTLFARRKKLSRNPIAVRVSAVADCPKNQW